MRGASAPLFFVVGACMGGAVARGQGPGSAAIVPCSLRCARDFKGMRALPRPSPLLLAALLPLAAARGCGLRFGAASSALCPAGPRGGPPAPAGAAAPRPRLRLRSRLPSRLAGPCPGCAPARAACPRPRPAPPGRRRPRPCALRAPGGPSGFPRRASSRLRSAPWGRGGAALGLSPSLAAPGRAAPGRGFVLGLVRWCACGRGAGVPLAAASGGRPPALAGGFSSDSDGRPAAPCP